MAESAIPEIDEHWWELLKDAVGAAIQSNPFATLVALLLTIIIVTVGPFWLILHYRLLHNRDNQRARFEKIRRDGEG